MSDDFWGPRAPKKPKPKPDDFWGGGGVATSAKGDERAAGKERRSVGYAEKQLVRLLGRLSETPDVGKGQQKKLAGLLTGFKPREVRRIASEVELPQPAVHELVDYTRQAQGLVRGPESVKGLPKPVRHDLHELARADERFDVGANVEANQRAVEVLDALEDYAPETIRRLGHDAGLRPERIQRLLTTKGEWESPDQFGDALFPKALEYLGRPGQAVLGGITEGPGGALRGLTGEERYRPIQTVLRVTGQSESEAKKTEAKLPGVARFVGNLAGDIATDPLTYVSFGTTSAAKQASIHAAEQIAARGVRSFDEILKGLGRKGLASLDDTERALLHPETEKILRGAAGGVKVAGRTVAPGLRDKVRIPDAAVEKAASKVPSKIDTLEALFRPRAGVKQAARRGEGWAKGLDDDLEKLLARSHGERSLADKTFVSRTQATLRQAKVGDPEELAEIRRALDRRAVDPALAPAEREVADFMRSELDRMDLEEQALKIRGESTIPEGQYFPHMLEKGRKAKKALQSLVHRGDSSPLEATSGGYSYQRRLEGSIDEVNAEAGRRVFSEDTLKAFLHRGLQSNADIANTKLVDELASWVDDAGEPLLRRVGDDMTRADLRVAKEAGFVQVPIHQIGDVLVREEIARDVSRISAVVSNDAATVAVLKGYDEYLAWWKSMATVPFPLSTGFSARNMMGNWFLASHLPEKGVRATIFDYKHAGTLQVKVAQGMRDVGDPLARLSDLERRWVDEAYRTGVIGSGFYASDVAEIIGHQIKPRLRDVGAKQAAKRVRHRANPLSSDFGPIAAGRTVNGAVENNARLALFLHNVDALGPDGAAALVRKYLFDYNDLTPFERGVLRRVAPFYTWARKSIPVMLESMAKQPGRWSRIQQAREGLSAEGGDPGVYPAWMDTQLGIPTGEGKDGAAKGIWMPDLPYTTLSEATNVPEFLTSQVGGALSPVKAVVENTLDKTFFSGRQTYPGQLDEAPFWASFLPKREVYAGQDPVPAMSPETLNFIESTVPAASKLRTLFPTSEYDTDAATRRLNALFGYNYWPLGEDTKRSEILRRLEQAQAIQRALEYAGTEVPDSDDLKKSKTGSKSSVWGP